MLTAIAFLIIVAIIATLAIITRRSWKSDKEAIAELEEDADKLQELIDLDEAGKELEQFDNEGN